MKNDAFGNLLNGLLYTSIVLFIISMIVFLSSVFFRFFKGDAVKAKSYSKFADWIFIGSALALCLSVVSCLAAPGSP
jgi:predicted membrane channel-forming protein YqfA (hemolysin III family)